MQIKEVSFGFTKNLGNFQSQRVDVKINVGDEASDDPDTALELAVAFVLEAHDMPLDTRQKQILDFYRQTTASERAARLEETRG